MSSSQKKPPLSVRRDFARRRWQFLQANLAAHKRGWTPHDVARREKDRAELDFLARKIKLESPEHDHLCNMINDMFEQAMKNGGVHWNVEHILDDIFKDEILPPPARIIAKKKSQC